MKRQGLSAKPYQPTQMMNSSTKYNSATQPCCFIFDVMGWCLMQIIKTSLKLGLKLKTKTFKIETIKVDEIREKLVKGKKYFSAYSKGEFLFTCTELQSKNLEKFLGNDYKILK